MWLYINGSTWLLISRTRVIQSLAWFHRKKKDIMTWQTPPNPYIPPANSRRPCLNCQFSVKVRNLAIPYLVGSMWIFWKCQPQINEPLGCWWLLIIGGSLGLTKRFSRIYVKVSPRVIISPVQGTVPKVIQGVVFCSEFDIALAFNKIFTAVCWLVSLNWWIIVVKAFRQPTWPSVRFYTYMWASWFDRVH